MASALTFNIFGHDKTASDAFDKVGKAAEKSGKKTHAAFKVAAAGAAVAVAAVGAYAAAGVNAAVEDQQSSARLATALKNNTGARKDDIKATEDWITKTAAATGVADDHLRPALVSLVGATKDAHKAQGLMSEALDIAAAKGLPVETVAKALAKAYNGNVGALSRLGIKTQDQTKAGAKIASTMAAQTQAQAKYNEAIKKFGPHSTQARVAQQKLIAASAAHKEALTHLSKTTISFGEAQKRIDKQFGGSSKAASETLAGKVARLKNTWNETQETVGYKLIPILTKLADWVMNKGIPALSAFGGWVQKNKAWIKPLVAVIATAVGVIYLISKAIKAWAVVQGVLNAVMSANPIGLVVLAIAALVIGLIVAYKKSEKFRAVVHAAMHGVAVAFHAVTDAASAVFGWLKAHWPLLLAILTGPIGLAVLAIAKNWTKIKNGVSAVYRFVVSAFTNTVHFLTGLPGKIASATVGMWDGIKNSFKAAINFIIGAWNGLEFKIPGVHKKLFGKEVGFDGFAIGTPDIPYLASGGIVTGPTLAMIGEAGPEAVIPLNGKNALAPTRVVLEVRGDAAMVAMFRKMVRVHGHGDVQVAFGS